MRIFFLSLILIASGLANASEPVRVGSKNFNESYLLSEMLAQLLEASGYDVDRRFGLGGTMICYEALVRGEIDVYVEYTGTLGQAILDRPSVSEHGELNELIADRGIALLGAFGFNNTYAIVIRRSLAESRGVVTIGDIGRHPELRIAVSHELLARSDGWPGLARIYALPPTVQGIEHGLAYQAIADDIEIDVIVNNRAGGNAPLIAQHISRQFLAEQDD